MANQKSKKPSSPRQVKKARLSIKIFRKSAGLLKRTGLAFLRSDLRKIKPTKQNVKTVSRFKDVIEGRAKAYKITPKQARKFQRAKFIVQNNRLILPIEENEKIYTRQGKVWRKQSIEGGEIISRILPIEFHNLRQYLSQIKSDPSLENLKPKNGQWVFRFFGNNSYASFQSLDLAIEYLEHYTSIVEALRSKKSKDQTEIYQNLEFMTIRRGSKLKIFKGGRTKFSKINKTGRNVKDIRKSRAETEYDRYHRMKLRNPQAYEFLQAKKQKRYNKWYKKHRQERLKYFRNYNKGSKK